VPRIVCISDTHALHNKIVVPDGDILVCAGDLTGRGELASIESFDKWIGTLPHVKKLVIAGNHDFAFERNPAAARSRLIHAEYLEDSGIEIDGLKFYGSPHQPRFFDWAFNLDRGPAIKKKWDLIPAGTDVLITHGPPWGVLDRTSGGERAGCEELLLAVQRVRPRLHVFGHIHEAYGRHYDVLLGTTFVNASCCDLQYRPVQPPIVVDL
jgi:Icc-related predicted phosphoesterase